MANLQVTAFENSLLFLGSGFSAGATNIAGKELPTGAGLKEQLAKILGIDSRGYDLKTLADEAVSAGTNLYQLLYRNFTVKKLTAEQDTILAKNWLRIYTTNYDDAAEFANHSAGMRISSFSYDDAKPKKIPPGSIVHLHGVIRKANEDNVLAQLVLNENSYIRQHFEKSSWYDEFMRDLRFCDACYFLGYSLADYHISALLMQNPTFAKKISFITRPDPDRIFINRVQAYGSVAPIGIAGFSDSCKQAPLERPDANPYLLKAFKYMDPFKDQKALSSPTPLEILNLISFGAFNYQRCLSTLPKSSYVVARVETTKQAISQLSDSRCLLVHSRLGNGKSIFLYILAHRLSEEGFKCFFCKADSPTLQHDVRALKDVKKLAIFFDSYNAAIDAMDQLADLGPDAKFVVAVRTGVQEVRLHEIQEKLPAPLRRINLNGLDQEERESFIRLLDRSGVRAGDLNRVVRESRDVREIVVTLYDHEDIRRRVAQELGPLLADEDCREVFIAVLLLKWVGHEPGPGFVRSVTGHDPYLELGRFREIAGDIFQIDDDLIQVRSAVFAEYILLNHIASKDILEAVFQIIVDTVRRKSERRYQPILSSFMQIGTLRRVLRNESNAYERLLELFERLHRDVYVNQEPLFWLQYSILVLEKGDLRAAEGFMDTAYARASANPGFLTFQLDTHAVRLWS
jgi:hypothetical protein